METDSLADHDPVEAVDGVFLATLAAGEEFTVGAGESYTIPGGEPHAALNESGERVRGVDIFSPPRENPDWQD